jgi:hypothetical protein
VLPGQTADPSAEVGGRHLQQLVGRNPELLVEALRVAPPDADHAMPQVPGLLAAEPRAMRELADGVHLVAL